MSGDIPRAPNRNDTGKAPQENNPQLDLGSFSRSKRPQTDDQTQRTWPHSNPRFSYLLLGAVEGAYATRTLPPSDVDPAYPALHISNDNQDLIFLDIPSFIDTADLADYVRVRYRLFDEEMREYEMTFSRTSTRGSVVVSLDSSDWEKIVRDHILRVGDQVSFDRYLDTNISDDFFYVLKYTRGNQLNARRESKGKRKVSELSNAEVDNMFAGTSSGFNVMYRRILMKTGSRDFPLDAYCLTKTLRRDEVTPGEGKLYLTVEDAVVLTDNPKIADARQYSKEIVVFDVNNEVYGLMLNRHLIEVQSSIGFCLGGEWVKFVTEHDLKEGDEIMIYKFLDSSFCQGYFHVVRYVKRKRAEVVRISNDPVRAGGIPIAGVSDQRWNIPLESAGSDQIWNIPLEAVSNPTASDQIWNIPSEAGSDPTASDQGWNIQLAAASDQIIGNFPLAAVSDPNASDQRWNIPLQAGSYPTASDPRRNIPLAAGSYPTASNQGWNIPLADVSDQIIRNLPLAAASEQILKNFDQRMNVPLVDWRRNIPLAAERDRIRNIPLAAFVGDRTNIQSLKPGSSLKPSDYNYCVTKTLDPRDVSGPNPRLHLDAVSEAKFLIKVPIPEPSYPLGKVGKNLLVYDEYDNPYEMSLSHNASPSGDGMIITYTLGGSWKNFVQAHGLRDGDRIAIYTVKNRKIWHEYYYVFKRIPGNE